MNIKRYVLAVLAGFVFVFGFSFLVHGMLLKGLYEQTASVWRPMAEHNMPVMFLSEFLFAAAAVFFFTRHYEGNGIAGGVRFGVYLGLVLAAINLGTYCYLPIPFSLVASWMVVSFVQSVGLGVVASLVYRA